MTAADQLAVGALGGAHDARRLDGAVDDEGEVAPDRLQVGERRAAAWSWSAAPSAPGSRRGSARSRRADPRRRGSSRTLGWNSPKAPMTVFGPCRMVAERPGWNQAGAAGDDLHLVGREAEHVEERERVGLGVEGRDRRRLRRPVPAAAFRPRRAAADAGGGDQLILRPVAAIDLADLEEGEIGEAAIGVALRRRDQAGQQARPHVRHVGGDRVGERERRIAAAEASAAFREMNDQVTASTSPRAASARLARRVRVWIERQHRLRRRRAPAAAAPAARCRRR